MALTEIYPGIFWLGLSNAGVLEFNTHTGKFHDPLPEGKIADELRHRQVNDILKDQNQLYLTSDIGLFVYDLTKKRAGSNFHFLKMIPFFMKTIGLFPQSN